MELNKIYHGDCFELMPSISSKSIDMVLCDLPYGVSKCKWDSRVPLDLLWAQYANIIKPNGIIVLTAVQPFTSMLVLSNLKMFKEEWIWEKSSATGHLNAKKKPMRAHESILVFYKKQPTYNPQITHGHPLKTSNTSRNQTDLYGSYGKFTRYSSTQRYPRTVLRFASDKQKSALHPTQKPVLLFEYLIKTYTNEGDLVLDNCCGSGTTGVACINTNRNFILIEKEAKYVDISERRIKEAFSIKQKSLFK